MNNIVRTVFPTQEFKRKFLDYCKRNADITAHWVDEDFYYQYAMEVTDKEITFVDDHPTLDDE